MRTNEQAPSENSSQEKKKYPGGVMGAKNERPLQRRVVDCAETGEERGKEFMRNIKEFN